MTGSLDATAAPPLDVEHDVRPHFPAFKADDNSFIFADNAGGSQILGSCVAAISDYLVGSNVQLGGGYAHSTRAAQLVAKGYEATAAITNVAGGASQCVIGSSTTQLASNLGVSCERGDLFKHGDEIVLSAADHEANVGPWTRLAERLGLRVRYWCPTPVSSDKPFSLQLNLSDLQPLLNSHTRLVAFTATSNLLGHATPVQEAVELIKRETQGRAMTVVDCVAFAPHGRIDMQAWGCDAVVFSYYKLFGPHLSALALAPSSPLSSLDLASLGHYFHPKTPAYKLAPGGAPYELAASLSAIAEYLRELGGGKDHSKAFARIGKHEHALSERLLAFLTSDEARGKGVRVVGPEQATGREPTISFVVVEETQGGMWKKRLQCKDIVERVDKDGKIGIKYGHFYATRIMPCLPLEESGDEIVFDPKTGKQRSSVLDLEPGKSWQPEPDADGVVRVSLVHYNALEEVDAIVEALRVLI